MIKSINLTKIYGMDFVSVNNLSFEIKPGEIVGFVGQNGAGKTTTLKMLTGILLPTKGTVLINNYDITKQPLDAKKSIGYISDNPDMFLRLTGIEYLNFISDIYDVSLFDRKKRINELSLRFEIESSLTIPMSSYSHGMRQKLMIIGALVHEPSVWILDEPMTGLDPKASFELKNMMKEHAQKGNSVFFSTHVLEVAEKLCNSIIIIKIGESIYQGTLDNLVSNYKNLSLEDIFLQLNK